MKAPGRACLGTKPGAKIGSWGRLTKMPTFQQLAVALGRFKVALAHRPKIFDTLPGARLTDVQPFWRGSEHEPA